MTRKTIAMIAILGMLLISMFGTVAAQDETPPPAPTEEPDSKFLTHPVVKLLSAYFGRDTGDGEPTGEPTEPPAEPLPGEPTPEPPVTPETIAEEIATYHEEGMGFGVLVKLYAMAEASREACEAAAEADPTGEECVPLEVDDLVTEFKSGAGMGTLFKEYGKPALLGVGHVKKALKNLEQEPDEGEEGDSTMKDKKDNKNNKLPKPVKEKSKGKGK